jgi:glycine cleavage system H protein
MTTQLIPTDRRYTGVDSWVALPPYERLGDHPLRVGLTESVIKGLRVISVEFPRIRSIVEAGQACAFIWTSPLSMMPVYAPITGLVTVINAEVSDDPTILASDPLHSGWLYAVLPVATASTDHLLTAAEYANQLDAAA